MDADQRTRLRAFRAAAVQVTEGYPWREDEGDIVYDEDPTNVPRGYSSQHIVAQVPDADVRAYLLAMHDALPALLDALETAEHERDAARADVSAAVDAIGVAESESERLRSALETAEARAVDDPMLDATDGAHPAWWRGHDDGARGALMIVRRALNEPPSGGVYGSDEAREIDSAIRALRAERDRMIVARDNAVDLWNRALAAARTAEDQRDEARRIAAENEARYVAAERERDRAEAALDGTADLARLRYEAERERDALRGALAALNEDLRAALCERDEARTSERACVVAALRVEADDEDGLSAAETAGGDPVHAAYFSIRANVLRSAAEAIEKGRHLEACQRRSASTAAPATLDAGPRDADGREVG